MESNNIGFRRENPFAFKFGQVFTGFGVGCGVGIGEGRPLNLGALPVLQQVTSAARGATDAFSGVGRHVNGSLRKIGAKNIEVGLGCGVGFGHGFGAGLAIKPGVIHRIQYCFGQALAKLMMKFGAVPSLSNAQSILPSSMNMVKKFSMQNPLGNVMHLNTPELTSQAQSKNGGLDMTSQYTSFGSKETPLYTPFGSRTEKVIDGFLRNPLLKDDGDGDLNELVGQLRSENNVLQMVLKHQQVIEELTEENEKLHTILVEELKISPSKLRVGSTTGVKIDNTCSDCFECRRRKRKLR